MAEDLERFRDKRVRLQPRLNISYVCTAHLRIEQLSSKLQPLIHLEMPLQNPDGGREVEMVPFPESQLWRLKESRDPDYEFNLRGAVFRKDGTLTNWGDISRG
jgi:hypothetical protein